MNVIEWFRKRREKKLWEEWMDIQERKLCFDAAKLTVKLSKLELKQKRRYASMQAELKRLHQKEKPSYIE